MVRERDMITTGSLYPIPADLEKAVAAIRRDRIDLSAKEMECGGAIVAEVREALTDLARTAPFPVLLHDEAFGAGSFGRRTQARPLDDVDLFFPLDAAALRLEDPVGNPTAEKLVTASADRAIGCNTALHEGPWLHSGKVLDLVVSQLDRIALPVDDISKNPRGRCAHFTYLGVNVDLVFVLWSRRPGRIDRYHLPSGAGPTWRTANPKDDQARLSEANQHQHNELLLPTIRCLKAWNDHVCGGRLKSIHLEVLATEELFAGVEISSSVSALTYAFENLPDALGRPCPDPTKLGPNLDSTLHPDDRAWVQQRAEKASQEAQDANRLASSDVDRAAAAWNALLLTEGPAVPRRGRGSQQPGAHNSEFGQPAHHCDSGRGTGLIVPTPRREDKPVRPSDQRHRRGEYA
jgi:hypothetical protein